MDLFLYTYFFDASYVLQTKSTNVMLLPTASFACLTSSPLNEALFPCPLPNGFLISASFVGIALRFPKTAFIASAPRSVGCTFAGRRFNASIVLSASYGTSSFLVYAIPFSSKIVLQQLSISSFAIPIALVGSDTCIFTIRSICLERYSLENFIFNSSAV